MSCIICGSETKSAGSAVIMPFVVYKILQGCRTPVYTELLKCQSCGFLFYKKRFSETESKDLYKDYRTEKDYKLRNSFEWWYNEKFRERRPDITYIDSDIKKRLINSILEPHKLDINTVLDYGGDKGKDKPWWVNEKDYQVYDINEKQVKLKTKYDLVILNNVLEHASYPKEIVDSLNCKYIYIEVPVHKPLLLSLATLRPFRQYALDIYKFFKYRAPYQMHEHINYFTKDSLVCLLKAYNIIFFKAEGVNFRVLARRSK